MIVVLSGMSGSGKTSTCSIVAQSARASGIPAGGIVCNAIFSQGRKVGIECSNLAASPARQPWLLARIRQDRAGPATFAAAASPPATTSNPAFDDSDAEVLRYGMWEFSKQALADADQTIIEYVASTDAGGSTDMCPPILFVDEIGPLELDRATGLVETLAMLDRRSMRRQTDLRFLVVARPDIAARLKERWPDSVVVTMGESSYPETAQVILAAFRQSEGGNY
jgi:nucleoside-triphosphatase THEP1